MLDVGVRDQSSYVSGIGADHGQPGRDIMLDQSLEGAQQPLQPALVAPAAVELGDARQLVAGDAQLAQRLSERDAGSSQVVVYSLPYPVRTRLPGV